MAVAPKLPPVGSDVADYLIGWLYGKVQEGPVTAKVWNEAVREAEAYAERTALRRAEAAELAKNNAIQQRRRERRRPAGPHPGGWVEAREGE